MIERNRSSRASNRGFTLVEMIVVTFLLLVAMLGLLAVFDASARINKSESDVADAQGAVRYGIYQMTRIIRMAGSGGLFITEAVLNAPDSSSNVTGITIGGGGTTYNNVPVGTKVTDSITGTDILVRPGTDMIEIRGVILSPLLGFDQQTGCNNGCASGSDSITVLPVTGDTVIGQLVNDDTQLGSSLRPQFAAVDAYTSSITGAVNSMLVLMADGNTDLHVGCSDVNPQGVQRYPQPLYNVGRLTAPTQLSILATPRVFAAAVNFGDPLAEEINAELPSDPGLAPTSIVVPRRVGILDDIIFFVAMLPAATDPNGLHPYLAQGVRRGARFEITPLADDVEDLQIAYGVDSDGNSTVTRTSATSTYDPDPNFSNVAGGDEWSPNVRLETPFTDVQFQSSAAPLSGHTGIPPAAHCPRLHAVMLSLLAKAHDPDPTYKGPAASGYALMDVPLASTVPITAVPGKYRRRVQTLRINLRNYAFQG